MLYHINMKKIFNTIITICLIATIGFVAYDFLHKLEYGNKIYPHVYNYTQNSNNKSLTKDIIDCSKISKEALNGTHITDEQLSYLDTFSVILSKLDTFEQSLSLSVISENKKSASTSKIIKSIKDLFSL